MSAPQLDINVWMARVFDDPPCWQLVASIYTEVLGAPVDEYKTVSSSVRDIARAFRLVLHKGVHGFSQIAQPVDFAVVLMGRTTTLGLHHCGLWYDGRVLHATPKGTVHQALNSLQAEYMLMEYWFR